MTQKDVAAYYSNLSRGDKGRFTAFVSLRLGGSPRSWQHRLLCVAQDKAIRPISRRSSKGSCVLSLVMAAGSWMKRRGKSVSHAINHLFI